MNGKKTSSVFSIVFAIISITIFSSCASLLYRDDVDYETTVVKPDGTIIWAPIFNYDGDGSARAKREADQIARQQATYQTTEQYYEWPFAGWDFEFDKASLSQGIAAGTYKLGKMINNTGYRSGYIRRTGGDKVTYKDKYGNTIGTAQTEGQTEYVQGGTYLIDPSKPGTYSSVYVRTLKERTIEKIDEAKYSDIYERNYQPLYEQYHREYIEKREHAMAYVQEKVEGDLEDLPDDMVIYPMTGGKLKGKDLKSIFMKRLKELEPETVLINGGAYDDLVIVAFIEDGVLICQIAK